MSAPVPPASERLGARTKLLYGVGLSAEGVKNNAFNIFLLFFYQQVVGLDPTLCGIALFVSLCVDAVMDPAIGAWSDRHSSKLGRRHPFMYAACVPLAGSYLCVFTPPAGMSEALKFLWLLTFAVGARVSMALFVIPHQSLVPELTTDPVERASLMSLRVVFAWMFGLLNALLAYTVFLRESPEHPSGLLNRAGYRPLAFFGALTMLVAMLVSSLGTQRAAVSARPVAAAGSHSPVTELPAALRGALRSASYRAVVSAGLCLAVGYGVAENMNNYMNTFFWGFSSQQIGRFIVVIFLSALTVLALARPLAARFESHHIALTAGAVMTLLMPGLVGLRLLGLLPPPGDPRLFRVLAGAVYLLYTAIIFGMTMMGAMIANVTDEHEMTTGARQEGLLFSAAMFISKSASGLGVLAAGIVLKLAQFPENASPGAIDARVVRHLGEGSACASLLFGLSTVYFFSRFTLTKSRHRRILDELVERRAALVATSTPPGR